MSLNSVARCLHRQHNASAACIDASKEGDAKRRIRFRSHDVPSLSEADRAEVIISSVSQARPSLLHNEVTRATGHFLGSHLRMRRRRARMNFPCISMGPSFTNPFRNISPLSDCPTGWAEGILIKRVSFEVSLNNGLIYSKTRPVRDQIYSAWTLHQ
jgi:hypothetical protein